jgi:hypothetical protein
MLKFEQMVKAPERDAAVYVFIDAEKGHTLYLSHTGMMTVIEAEKSKSGTMRAAGFVVGQSGCSGCDGC